VTDDAYLFVVAYDDDAERKRAEYLFNNVEGTAERPEGLVRIVRDVDHEELYTKLVAKVPEEQVSAYRLDPTEADVDPETVTVSETVDATPDAVETFVEYMFSKKKAVLQSATHNEYEVYSKKGRAEVSYRLSGGPPTTVEIRVTGLTDAAEFLAGFFRSELGDYAASQRTDDT
jgi:hypothetical protein